VANGGDDDIMRGTRLHWLDSRLGLDDFIPSPYVPVKMSQSPSPSARLAVDLLGKRITINEMGFPSEVICYTASPRGQTVSTSVITGMSLDIEGYAAVEGWSFTVVESSTLQVSWRAQGTFKHNQSTASEVTATVSGIVDLTGYLDYNVTLLQDNAMAAEVVLRVVPNADFQFGMGFGQYGGYLKTLIPDPTKPMDWRWDGTNGNNAAWVGSTKGGVRTFLKGRDPLWQAGVPYDSRKSPVPPSSWSNNGRGGARLHQNGTFEAYTALSASSLPPDSDDTAPRSQLELLFSQVITPVRPLNLTRHWEQRWVQIGYPTANDANFSYLAEQGATIVNLHQGTTANPWINYPYLTTPLLKKAAASCHEHSMKFSVYNTMRELSNRCLELWAMLQFNETYVPGEQGGADWLQEHISGSDFTYSPAWSTPLANYQQDAAIRVRALSRWNNYYAAGLNQMKREYQVDGIYLDEIAYDRLTMLRARAVLGEGGVIDHHSDRGGFCYSPALNYMELYPFIDRLWYGEGFKYATSSPDYWLVEISGIAFGLTSDMLRYSGSVPAHYKGFLHGSSNRWQDALTPGTTSPYTPTGLWNLQKKFGIQNSSMFGWWLAVEEGPSAIPVQSSHDDVKVTTYVKQGEAAMVVMASFSQDDLDNVTLSFDLGAMGLDSAAHLAAPEILPFQPNGTNQLPLDHAFQVPAQKGWVLLLSKN